MRKLVVFNLITLDGFFAGPHGEIDWHNVDAEFQKFAVEQTKTFTTHMYGRVTYEMMASYWTTAEARKEDPIISLLMNTTPKVVFSKTLADVQESDHWKNVTLYHDITPKIIKDLKQDGTGDIAVLGSGTVVQALTDLRLVDEYRLLVNPIIIGKGKPLFKDVKERLKLTLVSERTFKNGNVLLTYQL